MAEVTNRFDLDRFLRAQAGAYDQALEELRRGRKTGHWIWFIFPQIAGLGSSPTSRMYAIASLDEARAYAAHPVLGHRLIECAAAMLSHEGLTAREILGTPDDLKFRSSMTLFAAASPQEPLFARALDRFFSGESDPLTLAVLGLESR
jgi:uncharacterized protein (DUF1810 family)